MADLDDFFAKKDKKKKTKKGFAKANTDVLAKNLEESERREIKAGEDKASPLATSEAVKLALEDDAINGGEAGGGLVMQSNGGRTNDDEWLDYANQKKDYSGLKIESLKITDSEKSDEAEHEINEEGEKVRIKKGDGGPWNKRAAQAQADSRENDDDDDDEDARASPPPVSNTNSDSASDAPKSSYVPPHMRGGPPTAASGASLAPVRLGHGGGQGGHGGGGMRRNRQAPDISSEVYFPSLSATSNPAEDAARSRKGGKDDFEEVRSGGQQMSSRSTEGPKLTLGNKFDALRE